MIKIDELELLEFFEQELEYGEEKWEIIINKKHEDLKVSILDKETKQKKKFLSALVNLFVKSNSKKFPESVEVDAERDKTKSFFNLFWRGIEEGLKKTLISKKIEQKEEKIKKIVLLISKKF